MIMAALSHLQPFQSSSFSSNKLLSVSLPISHNKLYVYSRHNFPRICATLTKKSRANRKVKSNEDLCKDIKEFLSMVGLPQDYVPSTKELSQHGRQDLANIVRRRGYKFIRELLTNQINQQNEKVKDLADDISFSRESTEIERQTTGFVDDISISGESEAMKEDEYANDLVDDISFPTKATEVDRQTENLAEEVSLSSEATEDKKSINNFPDDILLPSEATEVEKQPEDLVEDGSLSSEGMDDEENIGDPADDIHLSSEAAEVQRQTEHLTEKMSLYDEATKDAEVRINLAEGVSMSSEHTMSTDNDLEIIIDPKPDSLGYTGLYSSSNASLEEKVAKFVQEGELDDIEEKEFEVLRRSPSADSTELAKSQGAIESNSNSIHGAYEDPAFSGGGGSDLSNGHLTLSCQQVEHPERETNASRSEILSDEKVTVVDHNKEIDVEQAEKADIQVEISRLRYMLHQKELELIKMQEQIEKEKLALPVLQNKAEKEISEAQKLISEKDAELRATEESLSGLKEVEVQYWGDGEIIEIAGSFNGWQQSIRMDPLPSSSILDPTGSRNSRLWRILLWLYPGVYEIKFIADGHWTIDPQRESVTRGHIHNNILRVDR